MTDVLHRRFVMRRLILNNYPSHKVESEVADSIDFMIERVSAAGLQGRTTCAQHRLHTAPDAAAPRAHCTTVTTAWNDSTPLVFLLPSISLP